MSSKGIEAERQLIRYLDHRNYYVFHSVGSRGSIDVLAWKAKYLGVLKYKFAIQVKATRESEFSVEKKLVEDLRKAASSAGFEPVLAIRFGRENWKLWRDTEEDIFEETDLEHLLSKYKSQPNIFLRADDPRAKLLEKVFS